MKKIRYLFEAVMLYALFFLFRLLPVAAASGCGGWIGRTVGPRLAASRKALANIDRALPDLSPASRAGVLRGMWDNLGRVFAEYPHLATIGRTRLEILGAEHAERLVREQRAGIFFTGHFANWELLGGAASERLGVPLNIIYRAPNNPYTARILDKIRRRNGAVETIRKSRAGVRPMIEALKAGRSLGILIDQKYNEGVALPFLGHPAMTSLAFVQLAQKFDCPLLPARIERLPHARFRLTIEAPLPLNDEGGQPLPTEQIAIAAHRHLERWVHARPEQWLWLHRRWRSAALANRPAVT